MTTQFWTNEPTILFNKEYMFDLWPNQSMDYERKLNAITRLIILVSIFCYLTTTDDFHETDFGTLMAVFLSNSGGAWDNAKKFVEDGHFGGKGSEAHSATVIGDTVGDPFKDTSGPGVAILIKVMSVVSLLIAQLIATL